jgi:hypothetical protein
MIDIFVSMNDVNQRGTMLSKMMVIVFHEDIIVLKHMSLVDQERSDCGNADT